MSYLWTEDSEVADRCSAASAMVGAMAVRAEAAESLRISRRFIVGEV